MPQAGVFPDNHCNREAGVLSAGFFGPGRLRKRHCPGGRRAANGILRPGGAAAGKEQDLARRFSRLTGIPISKLLT